MDRNCFGKTKEYYTFVKKEIPKIENNNERFQYCRSMISIYGYKKYFYIGISKNPTKKIRKLNKINNLYYLYSFDSCSFDDARTVINTLLNYYFKSDYCLNKNKTVDKIKLTKEKYFVYIALKSKLKYF
jgi:hypothetical protein